MFFIYIEDIYLVNKYKYERYVKYSQWDNTRWKGTTFPPFSEFSKANIS